MRYRVRDTQGYFSRELYSNDTQIIISYFYTLAEYKAKAIRSGAIEVILKAISKHFDDSSLCEHGCNVLSSITDYDRKISYNPILNEYKLP